MNAYETTNTYAGDTFKFKLYKSNLERDALFGFNYLQRQPLQQSYHDNHFYNTQPGPVRDIRAAPKDYYFDLRTAPCQKSVIGSIHARPNLYNDNVLPHTRTLQRLESHKTWEPLSNTAAPFMKGQYVSWQPHAPCEVAPNYDDKLWVADMNSKLYERRMITGARETPYANHYRRQGMLNLTAQYMRPDGDPYTKKLSTSNDSLCATLSHNGGHPPAVTGL